MAKEQDLREEILKASPVLDAFLTYNQKDRASKLIEMTLRKLQEFKEQGNFTDQFGGAMIAHTNTIARLRVFSDNSLNPGVNAAERIIFVAELLCIGAEIGLVSSDPKDSSLFTDEITQVAEAQRYIKKDSFTFNMALVESVLITGFTLAKQEASGLDPFQDFMDKRP